MATAAVPAIGSAAANSRRTQFLSDMSGMLEGARQYAVAKNTYVWVAFTDNSSSTLSAVAVAARDGLSQGFGPDDTWTAQTIDLANAVNFVQVSRVKALGDFSVNTADDLSKGPSFRVRQSGTPVDFPRTIQFSPDGSARISAGIQGSLVLNTLDVTKRFSDRLQVNGPTGFVQVESGTDGE